MSDNHDEAWFAPRFRPRQRSARPITWQGWAVCIGYGLLIAASAFLFLISRIAAAVVLVAGTAAFVWILNRKTAGR